MKIQMKRHKPAVQSGSILFISVKNIHYNLEISPYDLFNDMMEGHYYKNMYEEIIKAR